MIIVAWIILILRGIDLLSHPFLYGKTVRIGASSWLWSIIMFALTLFVCGRVLLWW